MSRLILLIVAVRRPHRRGIWYLSTVPTEAPTTTIEADVAAAGQCQLGPLLLLGAARAARHPGDRAAGGAAAPQPAPSRRPTRSRRSRRRHRRRRPPVEPGGRRKRGRSGLRRNARRRRRRRSNIPAGRAATRGTVGLLDPRDRRAWARSRGAMPSGAFLSTLMRRMDTPIASRWAQIALRNALARPDPGAARRPPGRLGRRARLAAAAAGRGRCGADAGRGGRYRPLHAQDDPGRGPGRARHRRPARRCAASRSKIRRHERRVSQLVSAMCASLAGRARERRGADRQCPPLRPDRRDRPDAGRKSGRRGLEHRPLGRRSSGSRSSTSTPGASGLRPRPGRCRPTGWSAPAARSCARSRRGRRCSRRRTGSNRRWSPPGSGVFSSQSMIDLYSAIYDSTDPSDLPDSDAWQLRQAFVAQDTGRPGRRDPPHPRPRQGRARPRRRPRRRRPGREPDPARRRFRGRRARPASRRCSPAGYDRAAARWVDVDRRHGRRSRRPLLGDACAGRARTRSRWGSPEPPAVGLHPPRREPGQGPQRPARRRPRRARPDQHLDRQQLQPQQRLRARARNQLDPDDRRRRPARPAGNRAVC